MDPYALGHQAKAIFIILDSCHDNTIDDHVKKQQGTITREASADTP